MKQELMNYLTKAAFCKKYSVSRPKMNQIIKNSNFIVMEEIGGKSFINVSRSDVDKALEYKTVSPAMRTRSSTRVYVEAKKEDDFETAYKESMPETKPTGKRFFEPTTEELKLVTGRFPEGNTKAVAEWYEANEDLLFDLDYPEYWNKHRPGEEYPYELAEKLKEAGIIVGE